MHLGESSERDKCTQKSYTEGEKELALCLFVINECRLIAELYGVDVWRSLRVSHDRQSGLVYKPVMQNEILFPLCYLNILIFSVLWLQCSLRRKQTSVVASYPHHSLCRHPNGHLMSYLELAGDLQGFSWIRCPGISFE